MNLVTAMPRLAHSAATIARLPPPALTGHPPRGRALSSTIGAMGEGSMPCASAR